MKKLLSAAVVAVAIVLPVSVSAQHSDIEFGQDGVQIFLEEDAGIEGTIDGVRIYESEFPTSGLSQNFTSDPGFASELAEGLGGFTPGSQVDAGRPVGIALRRRRQTRPDARKADVCSGPVRSLSSVGQRWLLAGAGPDIGFQSFQSPRPADFDSRTF